MKYKGKTLTKEQEKNLNKIIEGSDYCIQAPPGSGKTLLLYATARKLKGYGLNVSFNKALSILAGKNFPKHVYCKTGHALAYGSVGWKFRDRLKKITGHSLANNYNIGNTKLFRTPSHKGYLILQTIRQYCYSDDISIDKNHLPKIPITSANHEAMEHDLLEASRSILNLMFDDKNDIPITHDIYLKKWALSNPQLRKSFVMFDEYQDANPVIAAVIKNQRNTQKLFVGDQYQQIYSWRGAINAISNTDIPTLYITKSFRFGQAIADIANNTIQSYYPSFWEYNAFAGNDTIESTVSYSPLPDVDCIICRTNNGVINETIKAQKDGKNVYILGGTEQLISLINGIHDLKQIGRSYHPELFLFNNYQELKEYANSSFGGDLKPIINLIEKYGRGKLIAILNETTEDEANADITITTCHKSKGMEWPTVRLGSDYKSISDDMLPELEEINILYVAITRALKKLDLSQCDSVMPSQLSLAKKINKENEMIIAKGLGGTI